MKNENELRISRESDIHAIDASAGESIAEFDEAFDAIVNEAPPEETVVPEVVETVVPEVVETVVPEVVPEETVVPEVVETVVPEVVEPVIDEEISQIKEPKNLSETNSNNWKKLQEKASEYKTKAVDYENKVKEYEAKLEEAKKNAGAPPSDYEELKKFRQTFDLQNDPDFKSKYEKPLTTASETIYNILKKYGAGDEVIDDIKKLGGPTKIEDAWWEKTLPHVTSLIDKERIKRSLVETEELTEKQQQELQEMAVNQEKFLESKTAKTADWYKQETEVIEKEVNEITKGHDWAQYKEVPKNAPPEQLKAIQKHNDMVKDLSNKFNSCLYPNTAKDRAHVAAAAVYSHVLSDKLTKVDAARQALETRVKALEKENSLLKNAGRLPRTTAAPTGGKITPDISERIRMDSGSAIDLGLDEALGE